MSSNKRLDLKKYSTIKQKTKDLVNGYIRLSHSNTDIIPQCVHQICCIFFYTSFDEWNQNLISKSTYFTADPANESVLHHSGSNGLKSAFLTNIVDEGKHCWRFVIKKYSSFNLMFGIWNLESDPEPKINAYMGSKGNTAYVFDFGYAELNKHDGSSVWTGANSYGTRCTEGSIIDIRLDFDALTLSYTINKVDFGVAFNIKQGKYVFGVTSYSKDNCIVLEQYDPY
eukprot:615170_1